jgi:hypothetical protein
MSPIVTAITSIDSPVQWFNGFMVKYGVKHFGAQWFYYFLTS